MSTVIISLFFFLGTVILGLFLCITLYIYLVHNKRIFISWLQEEVDRVMEVEDKTEDWKRGYIDMAEKVLRVLKK